MKTMTMRVLSLGTILTATACGASNNAGPGASPADPAGRTTATASPLAYKSGNPAEWPKEQDAVIAAPKNHKVMLENEKVRVLDVTLVPGEVEAVHSHRWPSVLYILEAGDFIDRDGDGKLILDTRTLPKPLSLAMTMWKEPEAPHAVENLSKTVTLHLVRVS
jgi:hypothetical protein